MESQLGDKRELSTRLPTDPTAPVEAALVEELRAGDCYAGYETPDHLTYVWFEGSEFKAEVWTSGQPQEVVSAETIDEVRENVEFFYGAAAE